ncbi:Ig-like domain-containing protein [Flagellimonas sp. GZD32]|uniref:Ig-like domain-containing protein n=1 Tax=Flagellimonas cixiensis TaxID=3228750 RepID=UPI0035C936A5
MKTKLLFSLMVLAMVFSCSKDDEPTPTPEPENQKPTVSFVSPAANASNLWNDITVEVNAADNDGTVAKVEFYAKGVKVSEATASPYTFNWNSKDVEDGSVELKATVTDDEGATATASITVEVKNVLLDYNIFDGYLSAGPDIINFTYITSPAPEKEILYVAEIPEGAFAETVQRPADFDDETFDVHFVGYYMNNDGNDGKITSYHGVTPGDFSPSQPTYTNYGNEIGEATVTFTQVPDHDYAMIFSGGNTNPIAENTVRSFKVYDEFNLGYVYLKVGDAGYYHATPFGTGNHELPLNAMNTSMDSHTFTDNSSLSTASLMVQGHTGPGRYSPAVTLYRENVNLGGNPYESKFHVPNAEDQVFDHYYTNARIQLNGKTYVHEAFQEILTSMTKLDATFSADNKTLSQLDITATSMDEIDWLATTFQVSASDTFTFKWQSFSADDNISFPPIPTEVVTATNEVFNSSDIVFKEANVTMLFEDRDNYNGYEDFKDIRFGRKTEDTALKTRLFVFGQP